MPITVRLPREVEERIDRLAKLTGRTKSYYLRELILKGLDDLEDYYLAADVLEKIRKGEEPTYSLEEVDLIDTLREKIKKEIDNMPEELLHCLQKYLEDIVKEDKQRRKRIKTIHLKGQYDNLNVRKIAYESTTC